MQNRRCCFLPLLPHFSTDFPGVPTFGADLGGETQHVQRPRRPELAVRPRGSRGEGAFAREERLTRVKLSKSRSFVS